MPVYIDPRPNKWTQLSEVLGGALNQYQQGKQADEQQQQQRTQLTQKQQEITQKLIQWYSTATPEARARFNQLNGGSGPPGFEGGAFNPTAGEQLPEVQAKAKIGDIQNGARPSMLPSDQNGNFSPSSALMTDPSGRGNVIQPFDRLQAINNRNQGVYGAQLSKDMIDKGETFFTQGTPGETQANQIANKQIPTGQESVLNAENARDFTNIKLPESKQKISGERTTQAKVGEEIRGLKTSNDMLGSMTGATGAGQPGAVSPIAQDIADRKYDPKLLRNLLSKNPAMAQALELQVRQIDPNFSMADYEANVATKKAYASGPQAQNVTAVNTAIRHLNSLYDNSSRMNNTRFPSVNAVMNPIARQFGNENIQEATAAMTKDADAVANELNKAFRGSSQLSEKDTASWRQGLGPNATPADIKGAVGEALKLLAGRNIELSEGYKRGVGRPSDRQFIDKGVQKILQKFAKAGVQGAGDLMGDSTSAPTDVTGGGLYGTYVPGQGLVKH